MPLNVMDAHFRSFGHNVLPKLVEQGVGVAGRVPALLIEPPDIGSDYGLRTHVDPGSSD